MVLRISFLLSTLTSILNVQASDTLILMFNSKDVNQYLHTLNGYDIKDSSRKTYYKINTFHYEFCKDISRGEQIYHYVFSSVLILDSTLFHSKYRKENLEKKESLHAEFNKLENKNSNEAADLQAEIKMINEYINPTKPISISLVELSQKNPIIANLSNITSEKEILILEKKIRNNNCFLVDINNMQSKNLIAYKVNFTKISPILKSDEIR